MLHRMDFNQIFRDEVDKEVSRVLDEKTKELRDDLEDFCARQPTRSSNTLYVGDDLELLLDVAEQERQQQGAASIDERHLLLALASDERLGGALLQRQGLSRSQLDEQLQPVGVAMAEPVAPPGPAAAARGPWPTRPTAAQRV